LHTIDEDAVRQLVETINITESQPSLNLQIAKAYPAAEFRQRCRGLGIEGVTLQTIRVI